MRLKKVTDCKVWKTRRLRISLKNVWTLLLKSTVLPIQRCPILLEFKLISIDLQLWEQPILNRCKYTVSVYCFLAENKRLINVFFCFSTQYTGNRKKPENLDLDNPLLQAFEFTTNYGFKMYSLLKTDESFWKYLYILEIISCLVDTN